MHAFRVVQSSGTPCFVAPAWKRSNKIADTGRPIFGIQTALSGPQIALGRSPGSDVRVHVVQLNQVVKLLPTPKIVFAISLATILSDCSEGCSSSYL